MTNILTSWCTFHIIWRHDVLCDVMAYVMTYWCPLFWRHDVLFSILFNLYNVIYFLTSCHSSWHDAYFLSWWRTFQTFLTSWHTVILKYLWLHDVHFDIMTYPAGGGGGGTDMEVALYDICIVEKYHWNSSKLNVTKIVKNTYYKSLITREPYIVEMSNCCQYILKTRGIWHLR